MIDKKNKKQTKKTRSESIYMVGIKGVGMTMLAQFLQAKGHVISGSDVGETFLTDRVLKEAGISVFSPFQVSNIPPSFDHLIYSSAFNERNNPELATIFSDKKYSQVKKSVYALALGEVFNARQGIAVCGSHGKTTTAAWLGYVLWRAGKNPSVLVGSRVPQFKGSSLVGKSKIFVAETDEYQNKLQYFQPEGVVLNNIDYDHPDFFKTEADYVRVFRDFVKKIPASGFLIANYRDQHIRHLLKATRARVATYDVSDEGFSGETVNYLAHNLRLERGVQVFEVNNLGEFRIKLYGRHNIFNALAVIAAARELKVPLREIKKNLATFSGTERRAQVLGKFRGALIIDDYAHHPTEIVSTLAGIRAHYPQKRLRVVFHPHTFTRTKAFFKEFAASFTEVDELIILDIYGSARERQGGVSVAHLVKAVTAYNKKLKKNLIIKHQEMKPQEIRHIPSLTAATSYLRKTAASGDLILLLGAGDVFRIGEELL